MAPFSSSLCEELEVARKLEGELASVRSEIVERLYQEMTGAPKTVRRFLLAVKRDCFNGLDIRTRQDDPAWPELVRRTHPLAERLVALEERHARWRERFAGAYDLELNHQRQRLAAFVERADLMRGIGLASPVLVENLRRLQGRAEGYGRRERRISASLLRYVSRAALKTSPFSTLTCVGLGVVTAETARGGGVRLVGDPWRRRSLVHLKGTAIRQFQELLLQNTAARNHLSVVLNPTAEEATPGRLRFLRPQGWRLNPQGELAFEQEALVTLQLRPQVSESLRRLFRRGAGRTYGELATSDALSPTTLDRLLDLGLLQSLRPYPSNSTNPEEALLECVRANAEIPAQLVDVCASLVDGKRSLPDRDVPTSGVNDLEHALGRGFAALGVRAPRSSKSCVFEDVFLEAAEGESARREIGHLSRATVEAILRDLDPLVRLSNLYSNRVDFLKTVGARWLERWPDRDELPVLELYSAVQSLFHAMSKESHRQSSEVTFNPLGLPELERVEAIRRSIWSGLAGCLRDSGEECRISRRRLQQLLSAIPPDYEPVVGPCAFIQPADPEGRLWVLNRLFEGTGRHLSRYTAVMHPEDRAWITSHLAARAIRSLRREKAEILDLMPTPRNPLNAHAAQTPRVLKMPGESFALPAWQTLDIGDLRVRRGDSGLPYLVDLAGRRLLPAHLGAMAATYLPALIRFLALFGPGDLQLTLPPGVPQPANDLATLARVRLGRVVIRRRQWIVPLDSLPLQLASTAEPQAFEAFNRWRLRRAIPDRVFLIEEVPSETGSRLRKPQYLDLRSPLFFSLLWPSLTRGPRNLVLEEVLPLPESMPRDESGRPWVVELQLDAMALGEALTWDEQPAAASRPRSGRSTADVASGTQAVPGRPRDLPAPLASGSKSTPVRPNSCERRPPPGVEIH